MSEFNTLCEELQIKGNMREALYHHLMSKGVDKPTKKDIIKAWGQILDQSMARVLSDIETAWRGRDAATSTRNG